MIDIAGRHGTDGQKRTSSSKQPLYDQVYVGTVVYVHPETQSMDVELHDSKGVAPDVELTMPCQGPSCFMGVMPERNSTVVMLLDLSTSNKKRFYPIAYFPPDPTGGRKYRVVERMTGEESDTSTDLGRLMVSKHRMMGEGDALIASKGGSEIYLDTGVEVHDGFGNEFRIRQGDGSVLATSRNNYMFTNGVWRGAGLIQRNSLEIVGSDDLEAQKVTLSDGRVATYVGGQYIKKDSSGKVQYDEVFTEYRLDVEDSVLPHMPVNDINSEGNYTLRNTPKVSFVLGNMVGNNPYETGTYGKFLAPRFIEGNDLKRARFSMAPLSRTGDDNQLKTKGMAWALQFGSVSFLGSDKEGTVHRYMGAGRGEVNRGWSLTTVAEGGRRESWGADGESNLSWSAVMMGGLSWKLGKRSSAFGGWGINVRSSGRTFLSHGDATVSDTDLKELFGSAAISQSEQVRRYAKIEKVYGASREEIYGDSELKVTGNYLWSVSGKFRYRIQGNFGESIFGDRSISSTGTIALNSTEIKTTSGSRTEKFVKGDDDKTILLGDSLTTIAVGSVKNKIGVGDLSTLVGAGSHKTTLTAGSFNMTIVAGNASVSTKLGNVELTTAVGVAKVAGTNVSITGQVAASLVAPKVSIGMAPTNSGVITMLSHKDYVTGLPLIPSVTVTAAL